MLEATPKIREAVGVFPDLASFETAIDSLESSGFNPAEISVLASRETIAARLGKGRHRVEEFEDDPRMPRAAYVPRESIGEMQGALIGALIYVGAVAAAVIMVASGGETPVAVAATAASGIGGGIIGWVLAHMLARRHKAYITEQIAGGGLILWVRTWTPADEKRALKLLSQFGAGHVHIHEIPAEMRVVDA